MALTLLPSYLVRSRRSDRTITTSFLYVFIATSISIGEKKSFSRVIRANFIIYSSVKTIIAPRRSNERFPRRVERCTGNFTDVQSISREKNTKRCRMFQLDVASPRNIQCAPRRQIADTLSKFLCVFFFRLNARECF